MSYDYSKTNFIVPPAHDYSGIKAYRRKRETMLVNAKHEPIRLCSCAYFRKLKDALPAQVVADGLRLITVWTLIEVKR